MLVIGCVRRCRRAFMLVKCHVISHLSMGLVSGSLINLCFQPPHSTAAASCRWMTGPSLLGPPASNGQSLVVWNREWKGLSLEYQQVAKKNIFALILYWINQRMGSQFHSGIFLYSPSHLTEDTTFLPRSCSLTLPCCCIIFNKKHTLLTRRHIYYIHPSPSFSCLSLNTCS